MKRWDLTWIDWAIIAVGLFVLLHFPLLISMSDYATEYDGLLDQMSAAP